MAKRYEYIVREKHEDPPGELEHGMVKRSAKMLAVILRSKGKKVTVYRTPQRVGSKPAVWKPVQM